MSLRSACDLESRHSVSFSRKATSAAVLGRKSTSSSIGGWGSVMTGVGGTDSGVISDQTSELPDEICLVSESMESLEMGDLWILDRGVVSWGFSGEMVTYEIGVGWGAVQGWTRSRDRRPQAQQRSPTGIGRLEAFSRSFAGHQTIARSARRDGRLHTGPSIATNGAAYEPLPPTTIVHCPR